MRIVLQRARSGSVSVGDQEVSRIGKGVVILLGIGTEDGNPDTAPGKIRFLVEKVVNLRIFDDDMGKMNRSLLEVGGEAIVVSQFTLYADTRKGRRPSYTDAAMPEYARPLVDRFVEELVRLGVPTQIGVFGAHMLVEIKNDGPVTIVLEK